jgi:hypothetical protein
MVRSEIALTNLPLEFYTKKYNPVLTSNANRQ